MEIEVSIMYYAILPYQKHRIYKNCPVSPVAFRLHSVSTYHL